MQANAPGKGGRKAFGTRDRVVACLLAQGDVRDSSGMASPKLAQAVGYPGSSIAFAQLLSSMERAGLITREVRGKRTYRVHLTAAGRERARLAATAGGRSGRGRGRAAPAPAGSRQRSGVPADTDRGPGAHAARPASGEGAPDYDELAHRLLVQVARRLVSAQPEGGDAAESGATARGRSVPPGSGPVAAGISLGALKEKVTVLEQELSAARAARNALEAENEDLREQLMRIRDNLDRAEARLQPRARPLPGERLEPDELALLQRLLAAAQGTRGGSTATSA